MPQVRMEPMLRAVTGPIRVAAITGAVLPHEHLRTDLRWGVGVDSDPHRWLDEEQAVTGELRDLRHSDQLGLVVELSCIGMGRDAAALTRISTGSRVPVVAATGLFTEPFTRVGATDVDELTARLMHEITSGLDGTGVFPGVIGEVGCWGAELTGAEERCLVAAARASRSSQLPVATYGRDGLGILETLLGEGLPGSRVSVSYAGNDPAVLRKIAEAGAYVSLASLALGSDHAVRLALDLIADGHAERLLLSSGVNRMAHIQRYSGGGYAHIFHILLPRLREAGVDEELIRTLVHDNPLRWLAGA
ncbi:phosphotriesterase-related protein [Nonomuraea soli]|uniref:Phosphotriesterase-related protein n=3 Tax=Nonomuraea soli TaxID=1032476 RepID=A0A7W0HMZ9_9ACTN|nr:phosphotriesterase-related protein [Nonomuraea soli]